MDIDLRKIHILFLAEQKHQPFRLMEKYLLEEEPLKTEWWFTATTIFPIREANFI